mgnify:CR=1 FL=1
MRKKIHYSRDDLKILQQIQEEVKRYVGNSPSGTYAPNGYFVKSCLIMLIWILLIVHLFYCSAVVTLYINYALIGIFSTLIFLNILHDAAHQSIFRNRKYNDVIFQILNLLGGNSYVWKLRHLSSHHPYPNIPGKDMDISQSTVVRLNGESQYKGMHRFQHFYMPLIYLTYTLFWVFFRDFNDFLKGDIIRGNKKAYPILEWIKLFVFKGVYFSIFLIIPLKLTSFSFGEVFGGFVCMHIFQSILSAMALLTAHVNEHSNFPTPDEHGNMVDCWAIHQIKSTNDFGTHNPLINYSFGGFNFHVAHHLFPNMSNIHYQKITPIIQSVIERNGLKYQELGMFEALLSHWHLLKKYSKKTA